MSLEMNVALYDEVFHVLAGMVSWRGGHFLRKVRMHLGGLNSYGT